MTTFKKFLFGFFGIYLFAALSMAQAQEAGAGASLEKRHPGQRIQEIYNRLDLTGDQKTQLEANKQQHREKIKGVRQEIKADKEILKAELMKPQLDILKINQIHDQVKSLQNQMEDEKLSSILAVRAILTPDQFSKFVNLMHRNKERHDEEAAESQEHEGN
jgi:Spy/CpxP family protein refolding chaperone